MDNHKIVSREERVETHKQFLVQEKEVSTAFRQMVASSYNRLPSVPNIWTRFRGN
jgi:predicted dithiol-disulfide oxidoreductase (DUF899 family)